MKTQFLIILLAVLTAAFSSGCSKQGKAGKYLKSGERYLRAYKFEEARVVYLNVLRLQPSNTVALASLGAISREDGNFLRAFQFLKRAQEINPQDPLVAIEMGELQFFIGDHEKSRSEALNLLNKKQMIDRAARLLTLTSTAKPQLEEARLHLEPLVKANPASRTLNEAWGHWLLRQGQTNEAIASFQKAIDLDKNSEDAYIALASFYRSRNDLEEARKVLEEAGHHIPPASRSGLLLVDVLIKSGLIDETKKLLTQIVDRRPGFISAWTYQAEVEFVEKKFAEAAKRATHILSQDPTSYAALMMKGRVAMAGNQWKEAIEQFQQIIKFYPKAVEPRYQLAVAQLLNDEVALALMSLDSALQINPGHSGALLLRAQVHLRTGAISRAVQSLSDYVGGNSTNLQAYLLLAQAYMATNDSPQALQVYQKASTAFPKNPEPIFMSGMVHLYDKRTNEATQFFEKTLQVAPNFFPAVTRLAGIDVSRKNVPGAIQRVKSYLSGHTNAEALIVLARLTNLNGDAKEAEAILQQAVDLEAESGIATQELVKLYLSKTNYTAALQTIEKGLAEKPDDLRLLVRAALIYDAGKRFREASQCYERILTKATNSTLALNNLAWLYSEELNQPEKAFELGKRARQVSPNDPYAADTLGWILYRRGDYNWAISLLRESAQKLPEVAEVQAHLGLALYKQGDEPASLEALQRSIASGEDFREKTNVLSALAILKIDPRQPGSDAINQLNQRLSKQPSDPVALAKLGQIHEWKGDSEAARHTYHKLLQVNPSSLPALISLARLELYQFKNKEKAIESIQKITSDQMQNPATAASVGRLLLDAGEVKRAYDILSVTARDPSALPDTILASAFAALRMGRLADAEAGFKRLSPLKDSNPGRAASTFLSLIQAYKSRNQAKIDEATVSQLLGNDPANEFGRLLRGIIQERAAKWQEARASYQDLLKENPHFALASKHLAMVESVHSKNGDSALALATKARETIDNDYELLTLLAQLNYQKANYSRALAFASDSLRLDANQPDALYYLGLAQFQSGDKRNGTNTLKRALTLAPQNPLASQAQKFLVTP